MQTIARASREERKSLMDQIFCPQKVKADKEALAAIQRISDDMANRIYPLFQSDQRQESHWLCGHGLSYDEFRSVGAEIYTEALRIIAAAWDGHRDSLRAETIQGMTESVKLYYDEYEPKRLANRCRRVDPMRICQSAKAAGDSLLVPQKYVFEVGKIYNGASKAESVLRGMRPCHAAVG